MHKHIYFVRHGESTDEAAGTFAAKQEALTKNGVAHARTLAAVCRELPIDAVITSDDPRCTDTAGSIAQECGADVVEKGELCDLAHPSEVAGKPADDASVREILEQIRDHADNPHWHYSDEENFVEFRERMLAALQEIIQRDEEHMLVVTHGHALTMIYALILNGKYVDPSAFYRYEMVLAPHTGVTYARFLDEWQLVTWNAPTLGTPTVDPVQ